MSETFEARPEIDHHGDVAGYRFPGLKDMDLGNQIYLMRDLVDAVGCHAYNQISALEDKLEAVTVLARHSQTELRLAGVRTTWTAPELMAENFAPVLLAEVIELIDSGECTPVCVLGTEDSTACVCRCDGRWHAFARGGLPEVGNMATPESP